MSTRMPKANAAAANHSGHKMALTPDQIKDKLEDQNFKNPMHAYDGYEVIIPKEKLPNVFAVREKEHQYTGAITEVLTSDLRPDLEVYLRGQGKYTHQLVSKRGDIFTFLASSRNSSLHIEYDHAIFKFARSSTAITFKLAFL